MRIRLATAEARIADHVSTPERDAAHAFYPALGYRDQHDHHVLYEKRLG